MAFGVGDVSYFIPWSRPANNHNYPFQPAENPLFFEQQSGKPLPQESYQAQVSKVDSSAIEQIDELFQQGLLGQNALSFLTDKDTGDIVVIVKDQATGEVLKEIPSQKIRDLAQSLLQLQRDGQFQSGLLLNIEV